MNVMHRDPEAFYVWATNLIETARSRWYDHPRYSSPFGYGSTRQIR